MRQSIPPQAICKFYMQAPTCCASCPVGTVLHACWQQNASPGMHSISIYALRGIYAAASSNKIQQRVLVAMQGCALVYSVSAFGENKATGQLLTFAISIVLRCSAWRHPVTPSTRLPVV